MISSLGNASSRPQTLYTYMIRAGLAHGPYPIINIGGDKNRMNKMTHLSRRIGGLTGTKSGAIGDKGGSDDKGVTKIEQR